MGVVGVDPPAGVFGVQAASKGLSLVLNEIEP